MVRDELSVLSAFLAVAEERSFTRAADRGGHVQHYRYLREAQLGIWLRTTGLGVTLWVGGQYTSSGYVHTIGVLAGFSIGIGGN